MGVLREITASIGGVLGRKTGDLLGQRIEASRSSTEEPSEEKAEEEETEGEEEAGRSRLSALVERLRGVPGSIRAGLEKGLGSAKAKVGGMRSGEDEESTEDDEEEIEGESEEEQRDEEENDGIRGRLPTGGPSLPSRPSRPSLPSLPSPSSVFFGVANTVLDGLLALLGEQDSTEADGSEEEASG